ncbi:MAG: hypothetical protein FWC76_07895 [Defluviitaleaceae bacterium]|nr:hypothetical protein [Defluviitaleaceae bacterium]
MTKRLILVAIMALGLTFFASCRTLERLGVDLTMDNQASDDEVDEIIAMIEYLFGLTDETDELHFTQHTYGRLSFQMPATFTEVSQPSRAFVGDGFVVAFDILESDEGIPASLLVWDVMDSYIENGFEQAAGLDGHRHYRSVYMNGVMWRSIEMTNHDASHLTRAYIMTSGTEGYIITFLLGEDRTDEDFELIERIFNTVIFDDAHHKAELNGVLRGINDGYGYMVFNGDRFYWFLDNPEDTNNFLGGYYHVTKGFTLADRFHPGGFMIIVYYTDAFIGGEDMSDAFIQSQSFTFEPHLDDELKFTVHVQLGDQEMIFERTE